MIAANSLRLRLMLLSAVTICVTLAVAGLSLAVIFERHLDQRVEQELGVRWLELAGALTPEAAEPDGLVKPLSDPRYKQPYGGAYWRVSEAGSAIVRSRSLWDQDIAVSASSAHAGGDRAFQATGPNHSVLYMIEREVVLDEAAGRRLNLAVALDHAEIEASRAAFEGDVLRALLAIALVLAAGSWLQINWGLRPLRQLRERLSAIHRGASARLVGPFPDEVEPLALDVNRLLERQDDLLRKARARAGDLAHGLKTPLTILMSEAERLEKGGAAASGLAVREQVGAMSAHVSRELARARTHGVSVAGGAWTDPRRTVERLLGLVARMPRGDALRLINEAPAGLLLQIDPDDFGEVMGNLLDNSRKFARGEIRVSAAGVGGGIEVCVTDDGPGVPAAIGERILQRGESAKPEAEGAGLGLAIVQDILSANESAVRFENMAEGGCRFCFTLKAFRP